MLRSLLIAIPLLHILMITGCAGVHVVETPLKVEDKILVVTNFDNSVSFNTVGTTVFGNAFDGIKIDSLQLNDRVENLALSKLKRLHPYKFEPPKREDVEAIEDALQSREREIVQKAISDLAAQYKAARVVLIYPMESRDTIFGTNQSINGLGVLQRSLFGGKRSVIHASFGVKVHDGASGKQMYVKTALPRIKTPFGWKESSTKLTDSDRSFLKEWFANSITEEIEPLLEWTRLDWFHFAASMPYKDRVDTSQ